MEKSECEGCKKPMGSGNACLSYFQVGLCEECYMIKKAQDVIITARSYAEPRTVSIKSGIALEAAGKLQFVQDMMEEYPEAFTKEMIMDLLCFGQAVVPVDYKSVNDCAIAPGNLIPVDPSMCRQAVLITDEDLLKLEYFANLKGCDPMDWDQLMAAQQAAKNIIAFIKPPYDQDGDDELTVPTMKYDSINDVMRAARPGLVDQYEKTRVACNHNYVTYTGLNETFEYCKNCNKKKGEL